MQHALARNRLCKNPHLRRALHAYVTYFNEQRSHQCIQEQIPAPEQLAQIEHAREEHVKALPLLGGLHHAYRRIA